MRYDTRYLGAIRSVASVMMVVSTALASVFVGLILDITDSPALIGLLFVSLVSVSMLLTIRTRPHRAGDL